MPAPMIDFYNELTAVHCRAGRAGLMWSQQKLADLVGVTIDTIGNFERGWSVPRLATRIAIFRTMVDAGVEYIKSERGIGITTWRDDESKQIAPIETPIYQSHVYFIQKPNNGPIKIGTSQDLARRFRSLKTATGEDLYLLLAIPGSTALEGMLHAEFADARISGEWFHPVSQIKNKIEVLRHRNVDDAVTHIDLTI